MFQLKDILKIRSSAQRSRRRNRGFSFLEVLFASAILAVIFATTITLLQYHRIQARKSQEQAMMLDFCQHYLEIARQKSFYEIFPGQPINLLYDGAHGASNIRFPANSNWQTLWTTDFRNFHPDLEWFESSSPQYRCTITNQVVAGGKTRSKHISLEVRWHPPLMKGVDWLTIQLDTMVYEQFN